MRDTINYRRNVGFIVFNDEGQLWWGKSTKNNAWQFPQGGMDNDENFQVTLFRELKEEMGLEASDVEIVFESKKWLYYNYPEKVQKAMRKPPSYKGQQQRWFLLYLKPSSLHKIDLTIDNEFEDWRWVSYWYPLRNIVYFKRDVYKKVLLEFITPLRKFLTHKEQLQKDKEKKSNLKVNPAENVKDLL